MSEAGLCEKYDKFSKMIEYRESEIFVMIPMIMIIKSCEEEDKGICDVFLPDIRDEQGRNGKLYAEVKQVLFENNHLFNMKQETDIKANSTAVFKSLKLSRKTPGVSPERRQGDERTSGIYNSYSRGISPMKYKTILGNKSEYTGCSRQPKDKERQEDKTANKKLNYVFYNILEKKILSIDFTEKEKQAYQMNTASLDACIIKVKTLSIEMERRDPKEWNTFLDVALES